jgi:hypothetical protein
MAEPRKVKTNMLVSAARVLYQYTKGKEDHAEWGALASALEQSVLTDRNRVSTADKIVIMKWVNDFRARQTALEDQQRQADAAKFWDFG